MMPMGKKQGMNTQENIIFNVTLSKVRKFVFFLTYFLFLKVIFKTKSVHHAL